MAGFTMLTNDEYKELILAQQKCAECEEALHKIAEELKQEKGWLNDLLLCITKGETKSQWDDKKFEYFDLAEKEEIAEFINANFVNDGKLKIREKNNA